MKESLLVGPNLKKKPLFLSRGEEGREGGSMIVHCARSRFPHFGNPMRSKEAKSAL